MAEAQLTNQLSRIDTMTNVELRAELKRRGCPTSGNKKDLLAKLRVAIQKEYEQVGLETASTTSTMDSASIDGRYDTRGNLQHLQQSPVVPFDVNIPSLNNSTSSANSFMTPMGGSPHLFPQQAYPGEVPLTYTNLQIHDQATAQHTPVYNLTMAAQSVHPSLAPMIPIPQQLTIIPSGHDNILHRSSLHNQPQQHFVATPTTAPLASPSPEKKRTRSKKPSVDSRPIETVPQVIQTTPISSAVEIDESDLSKIINPSIDEGLIAPTSDVNDGNRIEVNAFVSSQEEQKDVESREGGSRSPSVGSSSAKSESVIKEIPLSGERHRLSRSKSPKSRWRHSPSPHEPQQQQQQETQINLPSTIDEEPISVITDSNHANEQTEKASTVTLFAEETGDLDGGEEKKEGETKRQETSKRELQQQQQQPDRAASQQQLKPSRSQTSSTLMKGLPRPNSNNRMNLSSDILKTLISDISLAPESAVTDEFESSTMTTESEQNAGDDGERSPNQPVLETGVGNGFLFSESMTIGELADQKQKRGRTVVIDLAVDSSSLNDDLVVNGSEARKKSQAPPARIASFESKTLLDGKTNALTMDEPVRVKDVTVARDPPSRILYIRGLTRPFTIPQLKELLSHYGTLMDGEFWLDKIKSQCFVTYHTLEEAQNAREALDGCRWPSTNPKTLSVRFARHDEFEFSKNRDLPPDQMATDSTNATNNRLVQEKSVPVKASSSDSPVNETKKNRTGGSNDVREWDLPKLQQDKEQFSPVTSPTVEEQQQQQQQQQPAATSNEPPPKALDDYFRKTKAKPAIYWLPLTEEQIAERIRRQEQRNAEREEEQRKRQEEEAARVASSNKDTKSRSNNHDVNSSNRSHRRTPSPTREKRKRLASNSPPSKRDHKRH